MGYESRDSVSEVERRKGSKEELRCSIFSDQWKREVGVNNAQGPPVPIPNTEVKLCSAEDTWLETAWEKRTAPTPRKGKQRGKGNLYRNLLNTRGCSSVGRAPALQAGGHGFESHHLHQLFRERRSGQGGMRNTGKRKRAHSSAG